MSQPHQEIFKTLQGIRSGRTSQNVLGRLSGQTPRVGAGWPSVVPVVQIVPISSSASSGSQSVQGGVVHSGLLDLVSYLFFCFFSGGY